MIPDMCCKEDEGLKIEGVSVNDIVEKYGTPVYVYSGSRIRENYRRLYDALKERYDKIRIHFAAKSNTNISILKILKEEGAKLDTVSVGEIYLALKAGFRPQDILFTGTNVSDDELNYLIDSNVVINVDSLSLLDWVLDKTHPEILSVRVNPTIGAGAHEHLITAGDDSKFGILERDIVKAYSKAQHAGVNRFGIHMHIGSGILDPDPHRKATGKLMNIVRNVREKTGIEFEFVDIGGGIGIPYEPQEKEMDLERFADEVIGCFKEKLEQYDLGNPYMCMEPGRYIVGDAGIILTRVNTIKKTKSKTLAGVDAGLHTLIRPAMYGAYHHMIHTGCTVDKEMETYDIMGPLCESSDFLGRERELPKLEESDILGILNAGAYGFTMASNYNSMLKPAEILINDSKHRLIREAETMEDLANKQRY